MQFLWAMLDVATIFVLGSGVYLWLKRGVQAKAPEKKGTDIEAGERTAPAYATEGEVR
jgi:uncharacterized iron-regulated membrane protein